MDGASAEQRGVLERFVEACEADERVAAAFLGGSFATGKADVGSDLDIYVVVADGGYEEFFGERREFMGRVGEPVFLEDFNTFGFDMVLFTFEDGVEGELSLGKESGFEHMHGGAYRVLVDKKGLLEGKVFPMYKLTEEQQTKGLRTAIWWFWDNVSHFVASVQRGREWSAYGSLDEMRMKCLKLARLKHDFEAEHSAYSKVEMYVPEWELEGLRESCCSLEMRDMVRAAWVLVRFYQGIAPGLATEHGVEYPEGLERVQVRRLEGVGAE